MNDHLQKLRDEEEQLLQNKNWDAVIPVITEIISLETDPNKKSHAYNRRGVAYGSKGKYDRAITNFDEAIRLNSGYAKAYYNRGNVYSRKGEYDRAIADFDEAIRLEGDYAVAYYNRGSAYGRKGEHDHAIADFNEAIRLNPNHAEAYNNRGNAYSNKGEYARAIDNYDEAIRLKPDDAVAYNNRGNAYSNKGEYARAIDNYDEAISLKDDYAVAYYNRGNAYFGNDEYGRAIADYLKADKLNPTLKSEFPFVYLASRISDILKGEKTITINKAFELYRELSLTIIEIQRSLFYGLGSVAHYTSLNTLKSLADKNTKNGFRLYNAAYMNDPEEGRVFFEVMRQYLDMENMFYGNNKDHFHRSPAYIGSFVQIDKDDREQDDQEKYQGRLFLWRTYGKQDGEEAAGSCLVFNPECFAKRYPAQIGAMEEHALSDQQKGGSKKPEERRDTKPPLYEVVYYKGGTSQENGEIYQKLPKLLKALAVSLNEIGEFIEGQKNKTQEGELKELVCELLDSIRFLFKARHYSEEREVRIIHICYSQGESEQKSSPIAVDVEQFPPRFYWETPKSFSFDEVVLGPRARRTSEWEQWIETQTQKTVGVHQSKIKYGSTD